MKNLEQKIAVVTGAGSGIGRATALALADEGCLLAISDISEPNLEETRLAIEALGARVLANVLDVADREAFENYASDVVETCLSLRPVSPPSQLSFQDTDLHPACANQHIFQLVSDHNCNS